MDTSTPYGEGDPENPDTPPIHAATTVGSVNEAMVEAIRAERVPEPEAAQAAVPEEQVDTDVEPEE